ncbi:4'-phosphopantetheinyl transferase superfamily protein [Candidatus Uhrbacteria bacterium]|nr:4'-phosphopantetheinyl transferase superfamily protein [Candidatus Uhrbacteria bacterium]
MRYRIIPVVDNDFFLKKVNQDLLNIFLKRKPDTMPESLLGRLLIANMTRIPSHRLDQFLIGSLDSYYDEKNHFFWSLSHKEGTLAVAVNDRPVGIDMEKIFPRDSSLFHLFTQSEWLVLGQKDWLKFYSGWTAKEAVLKVLSLDLACQSGVRIVEKTDRGFVLTYGTQHITVDVFQKKDFMVALAQVEVSYSLESDPGNAQEVSD